MSHGGPERPGGQSEQPHITRIPAEQAVQIGGGIRKLQFRALPKRIWRSETGQEGNTSESGFPTEPQDFAGRIGEGGPITFDTVGHAEGSLNVIDVYNRRLENIAKKYGIEDDEKEEFLRDIRQATGELLGTRDIQLTAEEVFRAEEADIERQVEELVDVMGQVEFPIPERDDD